MPKNPIMYEAAKYVHFIKNLSKCHFSEPMQFCGTGGKGLGIPLNHRWSQLVAPTHISNMCSVTWFRPKRKLILALFLNPNGENFDLLCISRLL